MALQRKTELLAEAGRMLEVSVDSSKLASVHAGNASDIQKNMIGIYDLIMLQELKCDQLYELEYAEIANRQAKRFLRKHKWLMFKARFARG